MKAIGQGSGNGAGTNTSDFSALFVVSEELNFTSVARFWSTTKVFSKPRYMELYKDNSVIYYNSADPDMHYSVRCLKD